MKQIPLTQGKFAIIDDVDFEWVNKYKWYFNSGYACTDKIVNGKAIHLWMHKMIIKADVNQEVDHINGDALNNQRTNLRYVTRSQNQMNRGIHKNNKTGYKGVLIHKGKYLARITVNRKHIYLGYYTDPKDAAKAYNEAAVKHHGEYAKLNPL